MSLQKNKNKKNSKSINRRSKKDNENKNIATDKGFEIHIKTQFGNTITVYGLNENSTMVDIEKKLEVKHGSAWSKSGIRYRPPDGIDRSMWFNKWNNVANKDSKLKDLGIKPGSTVIWNTVYSKYKAGLSDTISDKIEPNKYKPEIETLGYSKMVSLDKILNKNANELKLFGGLLSKRGWCLIKYPKQIKKIIDETCKNVYNAIKNKDKSNDDEKKIEIDSNWCQLLDGYGYINFKDYKQVLRVLTGNLMRKYKDKYPKIIAKDIMNISDVMDKLTLDILNVIGVDENLFKCKSMEEFEKLCLEKDCNITILSGYNRGDKKDIKTSLLDFVYYENLDYKKEESEYPMIKNKGENVSPHTDPGLFSLSFLSTSKGLQLYDLTHDCWREIDNDCGVFWCGEAAATISNGTILSGIHRVKFNGNNPRFTSWYECSVDSQLTKAALE
eukprot:53133_1